MTASYPRVQRVHKCVPGTSESRGAVMPVVITAFEVPIGQLDGFTPPGPAAIPQAVYRAVADGARFPVLTLASAKTGEEADRLVAAHRTVAGAMAGSYEVHHANRSAAPAYAAGND